jgi:hypothetical protein
MALAEALEIVSHDRLTRMLQADWSGQLRIENAGRTLFVWERGYFRYGNGSPKNGPLWCNSSILCGI